MPFPQNSMANPFDPDNIAPVDEQGRPHLTVTPQGSDQQTVQGGFGGAPDFGGAQVEQIASRPRSISPVPELEYLRNQDFQPINPMTPGGGGGVTAAGRSTGILSRLPTGSGEEPTARVSTRVPTGKKATEDPLGDPRLQIGLDAMQRSPKVFDQATDQIRNYPNLPADAVKEGVPASKVAESFVQHVKDNLLFLHDSVPPEIRDRSSKWYEGGRKIVDDLSQEYGTHPNSSAATIAALSPQKDWFQNVDLARRMHDIHFNKGDEPFSPGMTETSQRIFANPKFEPMLREIEGKTYNQLTDPTEKAMWLRLYDEAHNPRSHRLVTPEGEFGDVVRNVDGSPSGTAWGSLKEIAKGVQALGSDGDVAKISPLLGERHKVRSFYNNLIDPHSTAGDVTIDTHAVAAGLLRPFGGNSLEVAHNFNNWAGPGSPVTGKDINTGVRGMYPLYAEAYRQAAAERGILPRQMQSITWEAARGLFPDTFKTAKNAEAADAIWRDHQNGVSSIDDTRSKILTLAGGIRPPDWHVGGPAAGHDAAPPHPGNAGELPRTGLPDRPAGAVDSGAGSGAAPAAAGAPGAVGGRSVAEATAEAARASGSRVPLAGLPKGPFQVGGQPYVAGPIGYIHDVAEDYMRGAGLDYAPPKTFQKVDKARAGRIAQAFDSMKHAPENPRVLASYNAMIDETLAQFQAIKKAGIKFEFIKPGQENPYEETPRLAAKDVAENKHLWVFPTEEGFGSGTSPAAQAAMKNNPLLRPTNEVIDGHQLLANDVFRIVHDVFGHLKDGNGFRADGEENAWRSHSAMYSDLARPAMTSETRGQNSWLNYGPHGDKNRTAKADTIYADQKIGLLPRWASEEGRGDAPADRAGSDFLIKKYQRAAAPMAPTRATGGRVQSFADGGTPNPFDQFDTPAAANPFDQFDTPAKPDHSAPISWGDVGSQALSNIGPSAGQFAKNIAQPFIHPIDTATGISNIAQGVLEKTGLKSGQEHVPYADATGQFFKDRFGGMNQIKHTLAEDPVGALADASTVLTGGGSLAARLPGVAGRLGEVAQTAGRLSDPLSIAGNTVKGAGSLIGRDTLAERQVLADANVQMTPGQMKGGMAKGLEDAATSVPILGDFINAGRRNSVESFNQSVMNQALEPIGESLSRGNRAGHEAVGEVETKLSNAYDRLLPRLNYYPDQQLAAEVRRVMNRDVSILPAAHQQQFIDILNNRVGPLNSPMSGTMFKEVESELRNLANQYRPSTDGAQRGLATALDNTLNAMRRTLERSNPNYAGQLGQINSGWAMYSRIRDAASRRPTSGGVFMPSDLLNAIKRGDKSVGKGSFARGDGLMQDFAEAGQKVLPSTLPDSGTPKRLMTAGAAGVGSYLLHSPHIVAAGAAAAAPYTRTGMRALNAVAAPRTRGVSPAPGAIRNVARAAFQTGRATSNPFLVDARGNPYGP